MAISNLTSAHCTLIRFSNLGPYTLHVELGKGGFATVYRVLDSALDREVALKVLKPGWTDDPKAVERFMREAKLVARLKHPHIVTIFDVRQAEGGCWRHGADDLIDHIDQRTSVVAVEPRQFKVANRNGQRSSIKSRIVDQNLIFGGAHHDRRLVVDDQ